MDYMDLTLRCLKKAVKLNLWLTCPKYESYTSRNKKYIHKIIIELHF